MDSHHALATAMQHGHSSNAIHAGARPAYHPASVSQPFNFFLFLFSLFRSLKNSYKHDVIHIIEFVYIFARNHVD